MILSIIILRSLVLRLMIWNNSSSNLIWYVIGVSEVIPPVQAPFFNAPALILNQYLNAVLELLPKVFFPSITWVLVIQPSVPICAMVLEIWAIMSTPFISGIVWLWFDLFPELLLFTCVSALFYNEPLSLVWFIHYSFVAHIYLMEPLLIKVDLC